jgi:hypothetical protein
LSEYPTRRFCGYTTDYKPTNPPAVIVIVVASSTTCMVATPETIVRNIDVTVGTIAPAATPSVGTEATHSAAQNAKVTGVKVSVFAWISRD